MRALCTSHVIPPGQTRLGTVMNLGHTHVEQLLLLTCALDVEQEMDSTSLPVRILVPPQAELERYHVVALRVYTTSSYEVINGPLRAEQKSVLPCPHADLQSSANGIH